MKHALKLAIVSIFMLGLAAPAAAAECVDVKFPNQITVDGEKLQLNGLGLREATMLAVDVYVAALYVPEKSKSASKLINSDTKKRLILRFVRDVEKAKVAEAIEQGIKKSRYGSSKAIRAKAKKIGRWMGDVEEGDRYTFTYIPGEGITVAFNGKKKGTIEGAKFAKGFLDIWLGKNPPNEGLKTGLLGGSCG